MKNIILKIFWSIFSLGILGIILFFGILAYFSIGLPKISTLADYRPALPSEILSRDGTVLAKIGKQTRELVNIEEVPPLIIDSFLAAEDAGFFEHSGVDYLGLIRAMFVNLKAGRVVQGGSTITQQVAKSLLLTRERSISRKVKDFLLALKIEKSFSKREILYLYLNQVYLGGGYYGIKSAFKGYFDKDLSEVSIAESAMVAGLLVAPGKYSPYVNPERAVTRQHYVLSRLLANNKISKDDYEKALKEQIKFRIRKNNDFLAGYFTELVRLEMVDNFGEDNFLTEGYTINTTLDYNLQQVAEKSILNGVKEIDKRQGFKGPIGKIDIDKLSNYIKEKREKRYKESSTFFTINEKNQKVYERIFSEEDFSKLEEDYKTFYENIDNLSQKFQAGLSPLDNYIEEFSLDENYEAVVTGINIPGRIIFVNIEGVPGIIPYENFRWAHERKISEERQYFRYIDDPSSIVSLGDLIEIKILKKNVKLKDHIFSTYKKEYSKLKPVKILNEQNYLLCELDQTPEVQGALASISPQSGEVISFVGGNDFKKSQFNRAIQSKRQPGSSFKPILYAAGLENGYTPASIIMDSPETLGGVDDSLNWKPRNYDGKFKGAMTFRNSLEQSRNVPTIKIADQLGVQTVLDFAKRIGFEAELDQDLSLALGSFGVDLVDLVSVYSIFPNGGKKINPKFILSVLDRDKKEVDFKNIIAEKESSPKEEEKSIEQPSEENMNEIKEKMNPYLADLNEEQVYDKRLAYLMTNLLRGVVLHGTGMRAKSISEFLGGKTGTTNNYVDAWFLGFSSNVVTGVWTGMDDNKTLGWGETGSKSALPIWIEFMKAGLKKFGEHDFQQPPGIINININKETGAIVDSQSDTAFLESFVEGTGPDKETIIENLSTEEIEKNKQFIDDDDYFENQ